MVTVTLYRREGTKNWSVRYRDNEGKRFRRSTGTADKAQAQEIADQIAQQLEWEQALGTPPPAAPPGGAAQEASLSWAGFDERIGTLEAGMIAAARDHAEAQFRAATQFSRLLSSLALRMRRLERRVTQIQTGPGQPQQ